MIPIVRSILLLTVIITSFIFSSCESKSNGASQQRSGGSGGPMTVLGIVVQAQNMDNTVRSSGTVLASEAVDLASEASGRIEKICFKEGAHVRNNDLLVKINDDDLQAQLKKTDLQIQLATEQAKRQQQLFQTNGISQEQYDIAVNGVNTLKADKENLISSIRKREIRAPFDGVVGLRYVSEGGYVTPATRIASMQKINPLKIDFAIPEKYAGKVSIGDIVYFSSEGSDLQFTGKLYAIEPKIDPTTRTLQLRALVSNKSEKIFPGAYVQIDLRLKTVEGALVIPTQAIVPVLKGQTVFVRRKGVVASVPVTTGTRMSSTVQITSGIAAGDTVITTGLLQVRPGMPVNVVIK
jgi:membrane fusion protein, multidrug efflux system